MLTMEGCSAISWGMCNLSTGASPKKSISFSITRHQLSIVLLQVWCLMSSSSSMLSFWLAWYYSVLVQVARAIVNLCLCPHVMSGSQHFIACVSIPSFEYFLLQYFLSFRRGDVDIDDLPIADHPWLLILSTLNSFKSLATIHGKKEAKIRSTTSL